MARPTDVAHSPRENTLTITWSDAPSSTYPVPYLRSWCPCAGCQGHSTRIAYKPAPETTTIAAIWEVGAYALGVRFSDGHDDGIYTWSWLRRIAYENPPVGAKHGVFDAGRYTSPTSPTSSH
jgi:DUF971 family protein